ncbi:hypothetical protein EXIGLDRAFT_722072 [Exidia glandulosa HHB12029]|uniref:Uncharacterized protein n=1 Tax=Exidia glandulosa HHB12029 TaxID=1314781 RepID=A0A165FGL5_EXIGL|nr:hypothetical protein EXIGLDRAFT_722072 [Exidia glandulosa HHB12029]
MNSRIFSLFLFFLSFGLFTSASPVATDIEAREDKRALAVVNILADIVADINVLGLVKVDADVFAIVDVFANAVVALKAAGPVTLSSADKQTVAKNAATAINNSAAAISKASLTPAIIAANVKLDAQIKVFLDVLGVVVVGIVPIVAKLIVNVKLLLTLHLTVIANLFINILGIVIIL